jgi:hypothetical protein
MSHPPQDNTVYLDRGVMFVFAYNTMHSVATTHSVHQNLYSPQSISYILWLPLTPFTKIHVPYTNTVYSVATTH